MQVCRRWRSVGRDPRFTLTHKPSKGNLMDTISKAKPGDTVKIPAGFYQEMLLIEKPLRLVGEMVTTITDTPRRGVVFQGSSSVVALANARCCFEHIVFRSATCSQDRSIVCYGPDCNYIRLAHCEVAGASGLMLPQLKDAYFEHQLENQEVGEEGEQANGDEEAEAGDGKKAKGLGAKGETAKPEPPKLVLEGCYIHTVLGDTPAVLVETGMLRMQGCTVTNNTIGIDVMEPATVHITNNDISFNQHAITMDGTGVIADNVMWGNLHHATINLSPDAVPEAGAAPAGEGAASQAGGNGDAGGVAGAAADAGAAPVSPRALTRPRRVVGGPPRVRISGNHIQTPARRGTRSGKEVPIRKRVRELANKVYGKHENDYDDWQVIGDSDLDTDEEDDSEDDADEAGSSGEDSDGSDLEDDEDDGSDDDGAGFMDMMAPPWASDSSDDMDDDEDYSEAYGSTSESDEASSGSDGDAAQPQQAQQAAIDAPPAN
ncbi:hypothetical protein WJX72_009108 [[Myrmecia] bisecta]|uniref:Right handed beta helix domain-containing protein n=1 Tax=[Myrmecia] bisecta TaxID=41462 RepID=A0AAW1R896_9CHLO